MEPKTAMVESYPQLVEAAWQLMEKRKRLMDGTLSKIKDLAPARGVIHQSAGDYPTTFCQEGPAAQKNPARRRGGNTYFHQSGPRDWWIAAPPFTGRGWPGRYYSRGVRGARPEASAPRSGLIRPAAGRRGVVFAGKGKARVNLAVEM